MAKIYRTDGSIEEVHPANGVSFTLKEAQSIVGGLVEVLDLPSGGLMLLNEEGKLLDLPRNAEATKLAAFPSPIEQWIAKLKWQEQGWTVIDAMGGEESYIAGDVLICEDKEFR